MPSGTHTPWINNDAIVIDDVGVVLCEECPCEEQSSSSTGSSSTPSSTGSSTGPPGGCADLACNCPLSLEIVVAGVVAQGEGAFECVCSAWNGTFVLNRISVEHGEFIDGEGHVIQTCLATYKSSEFACETILDEGCFPCGELETSLCYWSGIIQQQKDMTTCEFSTCTLAFAANDCTAAYDGYAVFCYDEMEEPTGLGCGPCCDGGFFPDEVTASLLGESLLDPCFEWPATVPVSVTY